MPLYTIVYTIPPKSFCSVKKSIVVRITSEACFPLYPPNSSSAKKDPANKVNRQQSCLSIQCPADLLLIIGTHLLYHR